MFGVHKIIVSLVLIVSCHCLLKLLYCYTKYHSSMPNNTENAVNLTLDDIFISVKTTKRFETTRLPIILKTWFQLAKQQTWFFTDNSNAELQNQTNGHMINTYCPTRHGPRGLNCKMNAEYNYYIRSGKKWFCHFDDDNYVNVFRLVSTLRKYDYNRDWYLGKNPYGPINITLSVRNLTSTDRRKENIPFSILFATGGAGFCISRSLASKMYQVGGKRGFHRLCCALGMADDVCIAFVIEYVTKPKPVRLTVIPEFHSHIEPMKKITRKIRKQISFSYKRSNTLNIPELKNINDPSRFLSLHCFLYPYSEFEYCRNKGNIGERLLSKSKLYRRKSVDRQELST